MKTKTASAIKAIKNNRKIKIFLFFLVLSSIIWMLMQLSKKFIMPVVFKVEYINLPKDKMVHKKPISELELSIKAPGFMLLKYKMKKRKIILNLKNISRKKNEHFILPNKQLLALNSQFSNEIEILSVLKDTIFIEIGNSISKKVPIIPDLDIQYKAGYNLVEKLKLKPDSVIISGSKKFVDSIAGITTNPLKLNDVFEDIAVQMLLKSPFKSGQIKLSVVKVNVKGKVDKFTEGNFKIPVSIINAPFGVTVTTFPKEIEVIYQAGLSNFSKITQNDVTVVFDYKQYENDPSISYLTPVIIKKSDLIYSLKINPPQLEFLIEK